MRLQPIAAIVAVGKQGEVWMARWSPSQVGQTGISCSALSEDLPPQNGSADLQQQDCSAELHLAEEPGLPG